MREPCRGPDGCHSHRAGARSGALMLGALAALACSVDPASWELQAATPAGAVRGELVRYIATVDDDHSQQSYALRPLGGERELPLVFAGEPDLPAGALVDVWGRPQSGGIAVDRVQVVDENADRSGGVQTVQRAILNGSAYPARSFAFVLVDVSNGTVPMSLSDVEAARRLFGTEAGMTPSVRQYYLEASYGRQDVTGAVFGPLSFPMTACNVGLLAQELTPLIPGTFDHYLFYIHPRTAACGWVGLAQAGRADRPTKYSWYNASAGCVVLVQEPGHNLGMSHSSAMRCGAAPFVDAPAGVCTHQEYGDRYDPMGGGCRHMNAFQKAYQGWFDRCNLVEATANGTFTLLPLELACDGVQALQVPMPRPRPFSHGGALTELTHYYLELRTPQGIDSGVGPVVQIRVSNDTRSRTQRGVRTWFLDMDPQTAALDGLGVGQSFADPSGSPVFTVEALDQTRASVRVEFADGGAGEPTCGDLTILQGSGPGPESCAAGPTGVGGTPPPAGTVDPGAPTGMPASAGTPATAEPAAGCTCRVGAVRRPAGTGLAGIALLLGLLVRRRRRT
jgi:MYXO-CTERM domain-containing protein